MKKKSNFMKWQRLFVAAMAAISAALAITFCAGCRSMTWRDFSPEASERPVVLFGRYQLDIKGLAWASYEIDFNPAFLGEAVDTNSLDTLPIFVIDSLCVQGHCMDSAICIGLRSWADTKGDCGQVLYRGKVEAIIPIHDDDLYYFHKRLVPGGFITRNAFTLPEACTDSMLSVELRARLLDRATGNEIARETKHVRFHVKHKRRLLLGS